MQHGPRPMPGGPEGPGMGPGTIVCAGMMPDGPRMVWWGNPSFDFHGMAMGGMAGEWGMEPGMGSIVIMRTQGRQPGMGPLVLMHEERGEAGPGPGPDDRVQAPNRAARSMERDRARRRHGTGWTRNGTRRTRYGTGRTGWSRNGTGRTRYGPRPGHDRPRRRRQLLLCPAG